jgi:hypothetical protein
MPRLPALRSRVVIQWRASVFALRLRRPHIHAGVLHSLALPAAVGRRLLNAGRDGTHTGRRGAREAWGMDGDGWTDGWGRQNPKKRVRVSAAHTQVVRGAAPDSLARIINQPTPCRST